MTMTSARESQWVPHPLLGARADPVTIPIDCVFMMWDNKDLKYKPLVDPVGGGSVAVTIFDESPNGAVFTTDNAGRITGSILARPSGKYTVTFWVAGKTFGYRTFDSFHSIQRFVEKVGTADVFLNTTEYLPGGIFKFYVESKVNRSNAHIIDNFNIDEVLVSHFEHDFDLGNKNIIVEGDSWFDTLSSSNDIYDYLVKDFTTGITRVPGKCGILPLQRWGHTSVGMLAPKYSISGVHHDVTQYTFLVEFLKKYYFELMILSTGGNDFALSMSKFLRPNVDAGHVKNVMQLLANNLNISIDFNYSGDFDDVANYTTGCIGNKFSNLTFPYGVNMANFYEIVLDSIYDKGKLGDELLDIRLRISHLLDFMDQNFLQTKVVAHTYEYPIYDDSKVSIFDPYGPYIAKALNSVNLGNGVLKTICIIGLIDAFKTHVLDKIKTNYPTRFDYADLRGVSDSSAFWADEMHMNDVGTRRAANRLYAKIKAFCPELWQ